MGVEVLAEEQVGQGLADGRLPRGLALRLLSSRRTSSCRSRRMRSRSQPSNSLSEVALLHGRRPERARQLADPARRECRSAPLPKYSISFRPSRAPPSFSMRSTSGQLLLRLPAEAALQRLQPAGRCRPRVLEEPVFQADGVDDERPIALLGGLAEDERQARPGAGRRGRSGETRCLRGTARRGVRPRRGLRRWCGSTRGRRPRARCCSRRCG